MKLLKEFQSLSEAEAAGERLRNRGILASVLNEGASQLYGITGSAVKVGLWVVLDEQVNDAEALLSNSRHDVKYPLTAEEMLELENQGTAQMSSLVKYAGFGFAVLLAFVAALLLIYLG